MTTNLNDKMLKAIDAYFSSSDGDERDQAEEQLLDVRDELLKQSAQRTWVGLTDEEIEELWGSPIEQEAFPELHFKWVRTIEAKFKEKNT